MTNIQEFLRTLFMCLDEEGKWTQPCGWLCVGVKGAGAGAGSALAQRWLQWPDELPAIEALAHGNETDVFFVPHLFTTPTYDHESLAPVYALAVDLDRTDVGVAPSVMVETSPGRHQGYWLLKEPAPPAIAQVLARNLAYSLPDADRTSWPLLYYYRLPFTTSYKRFEAQTVHVVSSNLRRFELAELELLPDPSFEYTPEQEAFIAAPPSLDDITQGPKAIIHAAIQAKTIGPRTAAVYDIRVPEGERPRYIRGLLLECLGHGMGRTEAYYLARLSPNNPYVELKYHGDRELAKDVLRAEAFVQTRTRDIREMISEARKTIQGAPHEKKRQLFELVFDHMKSEGDFIRTSDSIGYYIRRDRGRPLAIVRHSGPISSMLDIQYGFNQTETEHLYTVTSLESIVQQLPQTGVEQSLSYYDESSNALLVHTGRKDVYQITADSINRAVDGAYNVVFPWPALSDPFRPDLTTELEKPWWELLFGEVLGNVLVMTPDEAVAMMTAWLLFLLFRSRSAARPILLLQGQPGSGKTAMFKRIYMLLYGRARSVGALTNQSNFDHVSATEALAVFDNVDTNFSWLPDKLAQASGNIDIPVRKLYSNLETVILQRKALVGLTAHNPNFSRPDVADRLIIITLERVDLHGSFMPEGILLDRVRAARGAIWGAIFKSVQKILATPMPKPSEAPQFRIEDFSYLGVWFTRALGLEEQFLRALHKLTSAQRTFALEEDSALLDAFERLLASKERRGEHGTPWYKVTDLYDSLLSLVNDEEAFKRRYKNPSAFGRHLISLQHPVKDMFSLEWLPIAGGRQWRLDRPSTNGNGTHPQEVNHGEVAHIPD